MSLRDPRYVRLRVWDVRSFVLEITYRSNEFITITADWGGGCVVGTEAIGGALRTYSADIIDFISFYPGRICYSRKHTYA